MPVVFCEPMFMVPPSLIHLIKLRAASGTGLVGCDNAFATMSSKLAHCSGCAFCATGHPTSLGTRKAKPIVGSMKRLVVGLPKLTSSPEILTLYHVACRSRPLRKVVG